MGNGIVVLLYLAVIVINIASLVRIFVKAGQPGWAAIVPIYNVIVLLQIVRKPLWWIVIFFIPFANIIAAIIIYDALAKSFGKGTGFTVGLILLGFIFLPILAFGDAEYVYNEDFSRKASMIGKEQKEREDY